MAILDGGSISEGVVRSDSRTVKLLCGLYSDKNYARSRGGRLHLRSEIHWRTINNSSGQDTAYSDEEFGSEHEYEGDNDDFVDEDTIAAGVQQIIKPEIPTDGEEKDTEQYDGDFDVDEQEETPGVSTLGADLDSSPTDFNVDDDQYDEEFGDDGKVAVAFNSSTLENDDALIDSITVPEILPDEVTYDGDFDEKELNIGAKLPTVDNFNDTTKELTIAVPHDDKETEEVLQQVDDSTGVNNGNEPESSNDEEHDSTTVTTPVSMNLFPKNSSTETVAQRRSSVPSSGASLLSEGYRVARAGSLPIVLPHDKWMATIPQEVSPKRYDRSRKPSACFPVQEETFQQNAIEDEDKDTDVDKDANADDPNFEPNAPGVRERAQSLRDLHCEKVAIPLRRAQSLLYTGLLPRVEEGHAAEETIDALQNSENEEDYSEDKSSDGEDSFESDYDNDEVKTENPSNEPSPATARDSREGDYPATSPSDLLITNEQDPLNGSNNDSDCVDKMGKEFPSGSNTPHYEGKDIPHNSIDETNDYEVDEFIEDEQHEIKSQLESSQSEIKATEPGPDQPLVIPNSTAVDSNPAIPEEPNGENNKQTGDENCEPSYDGDDDFLDSDAETPAYEVLDQEACEDPVEREVYEQDADDFKVAVEQQDNPQVAEVVDDLEKENSSVEVKEDTQPAIVVSGSDKKATNTEAETAAPLSENVVTTAGEGLDQPSDALEPIEPSPIENQVEKDQKNTPAISKALPPSRPENVNVVSRPARPKQLVKVVDPPAKQSSPPLNPSRPPTKRTAPTPDPPTVSITTPTTSPQSSRNHLKNNPSTPADSAAESDPTTSIRQRIPRQKISSPWTPSRTSSGPYQYIPLDYPQMPRKEPVPRQKIGPKPSSSHGAKRPLLQPVRTPADKRFDFPKMDKTKRDWLFVNMFRHGDDLTKYETFMPPALLARPPTTMKMKKRPISARQVYGNTHSSEFASSGRKLVSQPGLEVKVRERNWVSTTPHDSKLPQYDSILDKHCTTVTSPMVQRQIYRTRHRDLSPQLAYVLEKRVEKHYRQRVFDSFGGVSSSYRTEIVPTFPDDDTRSRSHA